MAARDISQAQQKGSARNTRKAEEVAALYQDLVERNVGLWLSESDRARFDDLLAHFKALAERDKTRP